MNPSMQKITAPKATKTISFYHQNQIPSITSSSTTTTTTTKTSITCILVIGASGDVAKKKIYPSLYELYKNNNPHGYFKSNAVQIYGYARSKLTSQQFRNQIRPHLVAVDDSNQLYSDTNTIENFLSTCHYYYGNGYDDESTMTQILSKISFPHNNNNLLLVYLAIPPNIFSTATLCIQNVIYSRNNNNVNRIPVFNKNNIRIILEKPFGHDTTSCHALLKTLEQQQWDEETQLFRIDHYLGKIAVRNIIPIRQLWTRQYPTSFIWNNRTIQSIHIILKETLTIEGRGGYYDSYGVVRDVIQNHLLQILILLIMDLPAVNNNNMEEQLLRDNKVQLLQQLSTIRMNDCIFGQYDGYKHDTSIQSKQSRTPTYACIRLYTNPTTTVHSKKWAGVPFYLEAGKALDTTICEVRIKLKRPCQTLLSTTTTTTTTTTLVMRIQPSPSIFIEEEIHNGHSNHEIRSSHTCRPIVMANELLHSESRQNNSLSAYAALILDVLHGKSNNFVRSDELLASWQIFTPILHEYEHRNSTMMQPIVYTVGSSGPMERHNFLQQSDTRSSL